MYVVVTVRCWYRHAFLLLGAAESGNKRLQALPAQASSVIEKPAELEFASTNGANGAGEKVPDMLDFDLQIPDMSRVGCLICLGHHSSRFVLPHAV